MEEAFDFVASDSGCCPDSNALVTIRSCPKEPPGRYSLQVPSPGLEVVFAPNRTRTICVRVSELRAPMGLCTRDELHSLGLYVNLLGRGLGKQGQGTSGTRTYPAGVLVPSGRVSNRAQGYAKVVVPSLTNHRAHIQRREQRVTIHWKEISTDPSPHDPSVLTSADREIEKDVQESVRKDGRLHRSGSETLRAPRRVVAHGDEGAYGEDARQHPRLNSDHDLEREGGEPEALELLVRGPLTSRLIIVFELYGSGQPTQRRGARVGYLRMPVRDLCSKTQNTTVIRTSAATMVVLIEIEEVAPIRPKWRYL